MSNIKVFCCYDKMVDITELVENPRNPNKHPEEQLKILAKVIKQNGWRAPITVSKLSGFIVKGHGRLQAAKLLGCEKVPVDYQEYENESLEYADLMADNRIAELSEIDNKKLLELFHEFDVGEVDFDLSGYTEEFYKDLASAFDEFEPTILGDPDEVPEEVETRCKLGDVWQLGNHRLMCGDSTCITDVEKLMNGQKADMVFTDPPYLLETKGGCKGEIGKALKKQGKDIEFISNFNPDNFLNILPIVFANNKLNAYIFCNKDLLPKYLNWAVDNKYSYNVLVWKKPNAIPIGDSHRPDIEYLLLFRKNAIWNNGLKDVNYSRCLEFSRENGLHPTMKPIELIKNEIQISSNKGSIVFDLFGGSGSTLIACEQSKRKCFTIELDPHYCDIIITRWETLTGKKAILSN